MCSMMRGSQFALKRGIGWPQTISVMPVDFWNDTNGQEYKTAYFWALTKTSGTTEISPRLLRTMGSLFMAVLMRR